MKKIYTAIDIGSDTIKFVVGEYKNDKINILASNVEKAKGIRKGLIVDPNLAINAIKDGIKEIRRLLNIDIDKVKVKYFDLALKKWVTQAIVIENGKQTVTETGHTGNENPEPVVKVDLQAKKLNKVTVKFKYKIKVTNEGQVEGYVKELKDYIPDGLKFVEADNPKWKKISDKQVTTDQVKDLLLKPGESTTVDIILTWENSDKNLGVKVNWAEISKDYNNYDDTPDIDSVPDNNKQGEDDIDNAPVILAIKTGEMTVYFGLTTVILITLAAGIYLIKRFVL